MLIKTENIKELVSLISTARSVDSKNIEDVKLNTKDNLLYLSVTNKEYYVSVKAEAEPTDTPENKSAVVGAEAFLTLVSSLASEEIELIFEETSLKIKSGKSKYSLPYIVRELNNQIKPIAIENKLSEFDFSLANLESILAVNAKEVKKVKDSDDPIHHLFYLTKNGCFTFGIGSCFNQFELNTDAELMLSEHFVNLFKLFTTDVKATYGVDNATAKLSLVSDKVYLCSYINIDDILINRIRSNYESSKRMFNLDYSHNVDFPVKAFYEVLNRLDTFRKSTDDLFEKTTSLVNLVLNENECTIIDKNKNMEYLELGTKVEAPISIIINTYDIKSILNSCTTDLINIKFGIKSDVIRTNPILITYNNVYNLIPEWPRSEFGE